MQTAQTVMLRPVTRLDERLRGLFHPCLVAIFDIVRDGPATYAASSAATVTFAATAFARPAVR